MGTSLKMSYGLQRNFPLQYPEWQIWKQGWLVPLYFTFKLCTLAKCVTQVFIKYGTWCQTPEWADMPEITTATVLHTDTKKFLLCFLCYFSLNSTRTFCSEQCCQYKTTHIQKSRWHFWLRPWLVKLLPVVFKTKVKYLAELSHVLNVLWDATQHWPSGRQKIHRELRAW